MKCPKCNKTISKKATKCRFCSSLLVKEEIEILEELPKPKVTKAIPLVVKKSGSTKLEIKEFIDKKVDDLKKYTKKRFSNKKEWQNRIEEFKFSLQIIMVIMLLVITIVLIKNIKGEMKTKKQDEVQVSQKDTTALLENSWKSKEGDLFSFNDNLTFKWNRTGDTKLNNYYEGTYTYNRGTQALDDMGLSLQELELELNKKIDLDNIYSMILSPEKAIINNLNKSNDLINEEETWWYILILEDEENAIALNKTLDKRYTLTRK